MLRFTLSLILIFALTVQSLAASGNLCSGSFANSILTAPKADVENFRNLALTKVTDIFSEKVLVKSSNGSLKEGFEITVKTQTEFREKFDSLLNYLAHYSHFESKELREWLTKKNGEPYPKLDPLEFKNKYEDSTLQQLVNDLEYKYLLDTGKKSPQAESKLRRLADKIVKGLKTAAQWTLLQFFIFGLVMPMAQTIPKPVMEPVLQVTEQVSRRYQDPAVQMEQVLLSKITNWLSTSDAKGSKIDTGPIRQLNDELRRFNFKGMTPEQAYETWLSFEKRYSIIFQRRNKTLPANLQGGRDMMKGLLLDIPIGHANLLSNFRAHYLIAEQSLKSLEEAIAKRGTPATLAEKNKIAIYKEDQLAATRRYAGALASYNLSKFMYSETARALNEESNSDLEGLNKWMGNSMIEFARYMRFEVYTEEFVKQVEEVLKVIDPTLPNADKFAEPDNK